MAPRARTEGPDAVVDGSLSMIKGPSPDRPRSVAAAACLEALAGCASAPDDRVDFDRTADFTQYKSFAFASPLSTARDDDPTQVSDDL